MDNITHSFTGAALSKYLHTKTEDEETLAAWRRTLFWLMVGCVNLPDADVLVGAFTDPITATQQHRGLSHSVLFAPIFALLPTAIWYVLSKLKDFKLLWITATIGIYVHILFDLVTSYGTQLLQPFDDTRYSLDLMFIIDPFFTIPLGIILLMHKLKKNREWAVFGVVYMVGYLLLLGVTQSMARENLKLFTKSDLTRSAALPQPLNPFAHMGLVRTEVGVERYFYSGSDFDLRKRFFIDSQNVYTRHALASNEGHWCFNFSRFPHVISETKGDTTFVRIFDMQFSFDEELAAKLGFEARQIPFAMEFNYAPNAQLRHVRFNGKLLDTTRS
ncbi:MAG TPA: metal-dependent hydrolase [Candidatus Kapabacteria bacterium]|nr:metal-dependent hydrolase [Candidatus Kapabacteria bacterium]